MPPAPASTPVDLDVASVSKSYGARRVLDGVSFRVAAGERVALTGASGSGKTTLLHRLGSIDRPDTGSLTLDGHRIDQLDSDALARLRREQVGTVFHLLPTLTAAENIELPLRLVGVAATERKARVTALLARVGKPLPDPIPLKTRFPFSNGGLAQNGGDFTTINDARMARLRPVTGYAETLACTTAVAAPKDDGIFRVDVNTGERTLIVSLAQVTEALRDVTERIDERHLFINHTLHGRNNDLIYSYCCADFPKRPEGLKRVDSPFTVRPDGSGLTRHETFMGSHPEWEWGPRIIGPNNGKQAIYDPAQKKIVESLGG